MSARRSTDQEGDQPPPEVNLLPGQGAVSGEALQQLEGRISRVVFEGRDGYAVYALTVDGGDDATVSVTSATRFSRGDKIVARGRWGAYHGRRTFKAAMPNPDLTQGTLGIRACRSPGPLTRGRQGAADQNPRARQRVG